MEKHEQDTEAGRVAPRNSPKIIAVTWKDKVTEMHWTTRHHRWEKTPVSRSSSRWHQNAQLTVQWTRQELTVGEEKAKKTWQSHFTKTYKQRESARATGR